MTQLFRNRHLYGLWRRHRRGKNRQGATTTRPKGYITMNGHERVKETRRAHAIVAAACNLDDAMSLIASSPCELRSWGNDTLIYNWADGSALVLSGENLSPYDSMGEAVNALIHRPQ
jgi:hypothetical protein